MNIVTMARMALPEIEFLDAGDIAAIMAKNMADIPVKRVMVNNGLRDPQDALGHGGITRVPFFSLRLSGRARVMIRDGAGEEEHLVRRGDVVLHAPESYARAIHETPGRTLRFTCDIDHLLCGLSICRDPQDLDSHAGFPPMRGCIHPRALPEPGASLLNMLIASPATAQPQRCAWVTALLWQIHGLLDDERARPAAATWMAMRSWLDERCHLSVGRSDCAQAFGVHPNHVARLFRQHGDSSFTECLQQLRMERAMVLLRDRDRQVQDIAEACGFSDVAYFVRRFRERFGIPPGRWRRERLAS